MVVVRGVNVYPSALEEIIRSCADVAEYQVDLSQVESLAELRLVVEPRPGVADAEAVAHQVETAVQTALNLRVPVSVVAPGKLPRFEMKAQRWVK
jgi:phenylacetate-CoA ligase